MDVGNDRQILMCPYCGSRELIVESDRVKVERIRNDASVEKKRLDSAVKLAKEKHEQIVDSLVIKALIALGGLSFLVLAVSALFS